MPHSRVGGETRAQAVVALIGYAVAFTMLAASFMVSLVLIATSPALHAHGVFVSAVWYFVLALAGMVFGNTTSHAAQYFLLSAAAAWLLTAVLRKVV